MSEVCVSNVHLWGENYLNCQCFDIDGCDQSHS